MGGRWAANQRRHLERAVPAARPAPLRSPVRRAHLGTCVEGPARLGAGGGAERERAVAVAPGEAPAPPFVSCSLLPFPSLQADGQCGGTARGQPDLFLAGRAVGVPLSFSGTPRSFPHSAVLQPSSAKRSSREASQLCIYGPSAPKPCRALAPAPCLQPAGAACSAAPTAPCPRPGVAAVQRTPPPRPVPLTALLSAVPVRSRPLEREERAAGPQECNCDRPYDGGGGGGNIGTAWLSRKCAQPPS